MPALNCRFEPLKNEPKKKRIDETREKNLKKRAEQFAKRVILLDPNQATAEAAQRLAQEKLIAHRVIDLADFQGKTPSKWKGWMAEWLGQYVGKEGQLAKGFYENKRRTANLMRMLGHNQNVDAVRGMNDEFKRIARERGVDKNLHGKLMVDLFEVGSTNYDLRALGTRSGAVEELLQARNEKFVRDMIDAGFSQDDIDVLSQSANRARGAFEEIRTYLQEVGYNIDKIDNIGYFPRIMTSDAESFFRAKKLFDAKQQDIVYGSPEWAAFAKKRNSVWYTVDDHKALQDLLGVDEDEMTEMLMDTGRLKQNIEARVDEDTLELLIDSGIMSRVPMTSSEFYEWYSTRYELPFGSFDDMFLSNPKQVLEGYVNELEEAAGNFGIAASLREQGAMKGLLFETPPSEEFVPVTSLQAGSLLREGGVTGYIHKEVGKLVDAAMSIERNPAALSALGQAWRQLTGILKTQLLTSPQYVSRIFLSNSIQYAAYGGEAHSLVSSIWDIGKYLSRGIDSFDNNVPYRTLDGRTYTHREFIQEFVGARMGSTVPIMDGLKRSGGDASALNPFLIPKKVGLMANIANNSDSWGGAFLNESLKQYKKFSSTVFQPFGFAANMLDVAFKLGLLKSVTKSGGSWDGMRQGLKLISTGDANMYDTFQDALNHVDRAYLSFDDIGKAPKFISQNVIPFFSFTFQSASAITRDVLRNPSKYATYARIYSLVNDRVEQDADVDPSSMPPWLKEDLPFKVYDDGSGNYVMLTLSNVHPLFGFAKDASRYAGYFGVRFGGNVEEDRERAVKSMVGQTGTLEERAESFSKLMNDTYFGDAINTFFNQRRTKPDVSQPNTFLGVQMPQGMEAIIRYLAPIAAQVNSQNFGQFGFKELRTGNELDRALEQDTVVRPGSTGIFGQGRSDFDNRDAVARVNPLLGVGAQLGLGLTYVEGEKNTQKSYSKLSGDLSRLKGMRKDYARALVEKGDIQGDDKLSQIDDLIQRTEVAKQRMEAYMLKEGITSEELDRKLRDGRLQIKALMLQVDNNGKR